MAKKSLTKYWAGVVDAAMAARRQITALRLWIASLGIVMSIGLIAGLIDKDHLGVVVSYGALVVGEQLGMIQPAGDDRDHRVTHRAGLP